MVTVSVYSVVDSQTGAKVVIHRKYQQSLFSYFLHFGIFKI